MPTIGSTATVQENQDNECRVNGIPAASLSAGTLTDIKLFIQRTWTGGSWFRVGVYQGGTSDDNPTGASLIYDSGEIIATSLSAWAFYSLTTDFGKSISVSISGARLWVVFKPNETRIGLSNSNSNEITLPAAINGDSVNGNGYFGQNTGTAFPATFPTYTQTGLGETMMFKLDYTAAGASPATLSSPTPSGTIASPSGATIGATTNQTSGTFYVVVDSAANLAGITAAQIKVGNKNDNTAAAQSGNSTVSTTTPFVGVSGLTPSTTYSYAAVQTNSNGDSNVVTGTFTTAILSISISDVDGDEIITSTQNNVVVTGTLLSGATVDITQGVVVVPQTIVSTNTTAVVFNTVFETASTDLKYGTANVRVFNSSSYANLSINVIPSHTRSWVTLTSVLSNANNRLITSSDLIVGDQLEVLSITGNANGSSVVINNDGTWEAASDVSSFVFRTYDNTDKTWGNSAVQYTTTTSRRRLIMVNN